jgi:hypothetical protein
MNPKSIAFVIHGLPMGGAEKFMISIVNHLSAINYKPIVILLSNDDTLANEISTGVPVIKVLKTSRYDHILLKKYFVLIPTLISLPKLLFFSTSITKYFFLHILQNHFLFIIGFKLLFITG